MWTAAPTHALRLERCGDLSPRVGVALPAGLPLAQLGSRAQAAIGPVWLQGSSLHQSLWPGEAAPSLVQPNHVLGVESALLP